MDKTMLINAIHQEECRIAITENNELVELEFESDNSQNLKGNIYKARISRIEPSLQAAFLDLGTTRNGFLQINDIHPSYFKRPYSGGTHPARARIQEVLEPGQELVVQVVKEERELKGATLTTYLSLPGRYLVLMPGSDRGGVSRKIMDDEQRIRLKKLARELEMPAGIGMIVRTAGLDRSLSELSRDLDIQLKLWEHIVEISQDAKCPALLYEDGDLATRVMRDYFTPDIREVIIDDEATYERVRAFVARVMPRYRSRIRYYSSSQPIFTAHNLDKQVEAIFTREVKLRSGGALVIEQLEALVAIDVNSGKATQGENIEETAFKTNLEAADEVARQLRLRDLGGLIVVDFIDMIDKRHRFDVEKRIGSALERDRARVEIGRLSKFGLLEMSRQRLRSSISSQSHIACPNCVGTGRIKTTEMVALEVLRKIQAAVIVGGVSTVKARLAPAPALFLLNNKRPTLSQLENEYKVKIFILADGRLRPDDFQFEMEARQPQSFENARTADETSRNDSRKEPEAEDDEIPDTDDQLEPDHDDAGEQEQPI